MSRPPPSMESLVAVCGDLACQMGHPTVGERDPEWVGVSNRWAERQLDQVLFGRMAKGLTQRLFILRGWVST